jgi:hypothetical protein
MDHFQELVDEADRDKNDKIDFGEWEVMGEASISRLTDESRLTNPPVLVAIQSPGSNNAYQWLRII